MNLGSILTTRTRRLAYLILLVAAAALLPWTSLWVASGLAAGIVAILAKIGLEARANSTQSRRILEGQQARVVALTDATRSHGKSLRDAASRLTALGVEQDSLRADVKAAAAQLAIVSEETRRHEESAKAALEREEALLESIESSSQRIDRTETIVTQLTAARGASQHMTGGQGRRLDGPPESHLADSIAQLWSDLGTED